MQYQIRFCRTADNVRIAYATAGSGPPIVIPPPGASHLEIEEAGGRALGLLYEGLAEEYTIVLYDKRGTGLSERRIVELTPALLQLDLEAVVEAAGVERFAMVGNSAGGPVVIDYVAAHPERVTRLVFFGTGARRPGRPPGVEERIAMRHLDRRVAAREQVEARSAVHGSSSAGSRTSS